MPLIATSRSSRRPPGLRDRSGPGRGRAVAHPVRLASFRTDGGDLLEFEGLPSTGEVSWHIVTSDRATLKAFVGHRDSPLRLYLAAAPAGLPVPWLIAAVDGSGAKMDLIAGRRLVDQLPNAGVMPVGRLAIEPLTTAGGPAVPDLPKAIDGYCGANGESEWGAAWCGWGALGEPDPEGGPLTASIYKCTAELSQSITHKSIDDGGKWRKRRFVEAYAAACTDPARIRHQYRALGFFQWIWKSASDKTLGPGFVGSYWLGLSWRRRRVKYERQVGNLPQGGVRSYTKFKW